MTVHRTMEQIVEATRAGLALQKFIDSITVLRGSVLSGEMDPLDAATLARDLFSEMAGRMDGVVIEITERRASR